jgi:hypothetical protein
MDLFEAEVRIQLRLRKSGPGAFRDNAVYRVRKEEVEMALQGQPNKQIALKWLLLCDIGEMHLSMCDDLPDEKVLEMAELTYQKLATLGGGAGDDD